MTQQAQATAAVAAIAEVVKDARAMDDQAISVTGPETVAGCMRVTDFSVGDFDHPGVEACAVGGGERRPDHDYLISSSWWKGVLPRQVPADLADAARTDPGGSSLIAIGADGRAGHARPADGDVRHVPSCAAASA